MNYTDREDFIIHVVMMVITLIVIGLMVFRLPEMTAAFIKATSEQTVIYTDGEIIEKYETDGFLGSKNFALKIKYADKTDIYSLDRETYLLLEVGQKVKTILNQRDYTIKNIAWDELKFNRYLEGKEITIYQ